MRARKKRPKSSVPSSLSNPFSALMRMTLPGVLISVKRSIFDRGLENIRRNVLFPSTAKRRALTCSRGLFELRVGVEIGGEEVARGRVEGVDEALVFGGAVFENVVEGVDRRVGDREQRAGDEAEERRLPARHFRLQERSDDEVVHFERAVGQPLAVERREGREPIEVHVEEIEGDRIFDVGGVEDAELAVERLAGSEEFQAPEVLDQLALAVEDDEGAFAAHGALQILGDEILQRGGLARAGAGDDPVVRGAGLRRDVDGKRGGEDAGERRAVEKRRGVVEVMRLVEFRRLGVLAARDAGDAVRVVEIALRRTRGRAARRAGERGLRRSGRV